MKRHLSIGLAVLTAGTFMFASYLLAKSEDEESLFSKEASATQGCPTSDTTGKMHFNSALLKSGVEPFRQARKVQVKVVNKVARETQKLFVKE